VGFAADGVGGTDRLFHFLMVASSGWSKGRRIGSVQEMVGHIAAVACKSNSQMSS
jgi:hypothetical protein